jgi:hypothetical protein
VLPLAAPAQWPAYVQTEGNVESNAVAAFADASGRRIKAYAGTLLANPTNGAPGYVLVYGADGRATWIQTPATLAAHLAETNNAHGGVMPKASNVGAQGQVLTLNAMTGRPYWADPVIEGGIQYLVTNGVARANARQATTNWAVSVTHGTWDGSVAVLTRTGELAIVSTDPVSRWEYDAGEPPDVGLTDLIDAGGWVTNAHGTITAGDIYNLKICAYRQSAPPSLGDPYPGTIAISNLALWTWSAPGVVGSTNAFEGTLVRVDDPDTELAPVNLRTLDARIAALEASMTPSQWAAYKADGGANPADGPHMAGRRVYLDNQWSLLADGRF